MLKNHKGTECIYKPILCQEGLCLNCAVAKKSTELTCELCGQTGTNVHRVSYQCDSFTICDSIIDCDNRRVQKLVAQNLAKT
jgi:hypothetical protein